MNEKELEALIAEVEENGMIAPPVYLKDRIMEEVHKSESAVRRRRAAKIEFLVYSAKIIGAAAAAIFCLTTVPMDINGEMVLLTNENNRLEEKIERDVEQYRLENERIWSEPVYEETDFGDLWKQQSEDGVADEFSGKISSFWNGITVWLGMEERNYE